MKSIYIIIAFSLLTNIFVNAQTNQGLIIHCTFDSGGEDLSSNQFNATLNGATISTESIVGKGAVYFDGQDDYVSFPENKVYFNGDYSISIWCKMQTAKIWSRILDFNQDKPASGNAVTWLIGMPNKTQNNMWFDQWIQHKGIAIESILDVTAKDPVNAYLNYDVPLNEWKHYVITYNSKFKNSLGTQKNRKGEEVPYEGIVTLYVDGKQISTSEYCLKPQNIPTICNWLGKSRFSPDPYFKGWMDDFRLYNRCLTDNEILELYGMN